MERRLCSELKYKMFHILRRLLFHRTFYPGLRQITLHSSREGSGKLNVLPRLCVGGTDRAVVLNRLLHYSGAVRGCEGHRIVFSFQGYFIYFIAARSGVATSGSQERKFTVSTVCLQCFGATTFNANSFRCSFNFLQGELKPH